MRKQPRILRSMVEEVEEEEEQPRDNTEVLRRVLLFTLVTAATLALTCHTLREADTSLRHKHHDCLQMADIDNTLRSLHLDGLPEHYWECFSLEDWLRALVKPRGARVTEVYEASIYRLQRVGSPLVHTATYITHATSCGVAGAARTLVAGAKNFTSRVYRGARKLLHYANVSVGVMIDAGRSMFRYTHTTCAAACAKITTAIQWRVNMVRRTGQDVKGAIPPDMDTLHKATQASDPNEQDFIQEDFEYIAMSEETLGQLKQGISKVMGSRVDEEAVDSLVHSVMASHDSKKE